jgi:glycosyltransferase involved in cell wall biosynthesis
VPRREALALQRDSEALLLLVPEANGRGRAVLTAKLFEYLAARRPIVAAVPPDGEAAELVRSAGAGIVVPPEDVPGITAALAELEQRWRAGTLEAAPVQPELRCLLSGRRAARQLVDLVRGLA